MTQYGFYFDATRCTGCKTCVLACKDYNDLPSDIAFRNVAEYAGGSWTDNGDGTWSTDTYAYFISIACNHCDNPICVRVCPKQSMQKDEKTGIVLNNKDTCIGCGMCAHGCPYGEPKVDERIMKAVKCDMCSTKVAAGEVPVCVAACSTRALGFGPIDELRAQYGDTAEVAPLPESSKTNPNLVLKLPANAKPVDDTTGAMINTMDVVFGQPR